MYVVVQDARQVPMSLEDALRIKGPDESLRDQIVHAVRRAITNGTLAPGQRLTEREFIELTGVSRTSVREALQQLQAVGLLERQARSLRVATLDADSLRHLYEVRAALEPLAARLFAERATQAEIDELIGLYESMTDDQEQILDHLYQIDEIMIRGARNPVLATILGPLHTRVHALRRVSLATAGRPATAAAEYREVFDAIRERDGEQAERASLSHIRSAAESALRAVEALQPPAP